MTPKETALELVAKYSRILPMNQTTLLDHKNCALIAVDKILNIVDNIYDCDREVFYPYWKEVKQEISDGAKDTADYIDRHIIESMKELAKEGFKPKLSEISDEEIINKAIEHSNLYTNKFTPRNAFIEGAKWYREQLKNKQ